MTLTTTRRSISYVGNGVATAFAYDFRIDEAADVHIVLANLTTGLDEVITTNYSITGLGSAAGGTVTYPVTGAPIQSFQRLTIARLVDYEQDVDISNQSGFLPEVVELGLDNLEMQIQQLADDVSRAIRVPIGEELINDLPNETARAGMLLGFDSSGEPIARAPIEAFTPDAIGLFAGRAAFNSAATDFTYLSTDGDGALITDPVLFYKLDGVGNWSLPIPFGPGGGGGGSGLIRDDVPLFETQALAEAYTPVTAPSYLRTFSQLALTDAAEMLWKKVVGNPAHGLSLTVTDGAAVDHFYEAVHRGVLEFMSVPGAVGDGATSDQAAFDIALDYALEKDIRVLLFDPTRNYVTDGLVIRHGLYLMSPAPLPAIMVDEATSLLPINAKPRIIFRAAATPAAVVTFQGPDADDTILGGGVSGLIIDGNNVATTGVYMVSQSYQYGNFFSQRTKNFGLQLTDLNGPISAHGFFPRFAYIMGSHVDVQACIGLMFNTNVDLGHGGVTSHTFGEVLIEWNDADPVRFKGNDSISLQRLKCSERAGFAAGARVRFQDAGGFASHKNYIAHAIRCKLYAEDGTSNSVGLLGSEASSTDTEGTGIISMLDGVDHGNGAHYQTQFYPMSKHFDMFGSAGVGPAAGSAQYGSITAASVPAVLYDGTTSEGWSWSRKSDDISAGRITGYVLHHMRASGAGAANVRMQLELWTRPSGSGMGAAEKTETTTIAVSTAATTGVSTTVTFASALSVARGDMLHIHLTRLPADAADTLNGVDLAVIGIDLMFESDGPASLPATAGPFVPTPRYF